MDGFEKGVPFLCQERLNYFLRVNVHLAISNFDNLAGEADDSFNDGFIRLIGFAQNNDFEALDITVLDANFGNDDPFLVF